MNFYFKILPIRLLIVSYQLTKFQGPGLKNIFKYISLVKLQYSNLQVAISESKSCEHILNFFTR